MSFSAIKTLIQPAPCTGQVGSGQKVGLITLFLHKIPLNVYFNFMTPMLYLGYSWQRLNTLKYLFTFYHMHRTSLQKIRRLVSETCCKLCDPSCPKCINQPIPTMRPKNMWHNNFAIWYKDESSYMKTQIIILYL